MKSIYILVIGAIYLLCSCSKEELLTYNNNTSERFIYFEKSEADSSEISIFSIFQKQTHRKYRSLPTRAKP